MSAVPRSGCAGGPSFVRVTPASRRDIAGQFSAARDVAAGDRRIACPTEESSVCSACGTTEVWHLASRAAGPSNASQCLPVLLGDLVSVPWLCPCCSRVVFPMGFHSAVLGGSSRAEQRYGCLHKLHSPSLNTSPWRDWVTPKVKRCSEEKYGEKMHGLPEIEAERLPQRNQLKLVLARGNPKGHVVVECPGALVPHHLLPEGLAHHPGRGTSPC